MVGRLYHLPKGEPRARAAKLLERFDLSDAAARLNFQARGHSSAGRAFGLHPKGRRFDPGWLHLRANRRL
jgi:hypothetical protein